MDGETVELDAELQHETDEAWLLDFGGNEPVWIPKSQGSFDPDEGTAEVPEWLAYKEGLI